MKKSLIKLNAPIIKIKYLEKFEKSLSSNANSMETSELVVDKVCRTCLSTSSESYVSFYNQDEFENVNLLQIFNQTFNQIVNIEK